MHAHGDRAGPARPPRRRRGRPYLAGPHLAALVGVLALTLAVAACGGAKTNGVASLNSATQTTNAGGSSDPKQVALAFARCMRQHGIDMPDPKFEAKGRVVQDFPRGVSPNDPKVKAAQQACQKYQPNGGQLSKPNPQAQQQLLAFARCMRQHGIDIPDPNPNGGGLAVGPQTRVKPDDPKFKAAQQACQKLLPNAGKGGTVANSGGGK